MKTVSNKEYVLLFFVSLVVFYTVLSLLGSFIPLPAFSGSTITGGVLSSSSAVCSGDLRLSFFPDTSDIGSRASALISGLENCNDKVVFVRQQVGTDIVLRCSCVVATGNGCGCTFPVDYSACSNPNFYAQVDMDGNGDYNGQGETSVAALIANGCRII